MKENVRIWSEFLLDIIPEALLLTYINFNPSMDK